MTIAETIAVVFFGCFPPIDVAGTFVRRTVQDRRTVVQCDHLSPFVVDLASYPAKKGMEENAQRKRGVVTMRRRRMKRRWRRRRVGRGRQGF